MIFKKKNNNSLFSNGMKIPKTAQDTIPFWEVYENGIFLVGEDRYTLIFSFENLDYSLLRDKEKKIYMKAIKSSSTHFLQMFIIRNS